MPQRPAFICGFNALERKADPRHFFPCPILIVLPGPDKLSLGYFDFGHKPSPMKNKRSVFVDDFPISPLCGADPYDQFLFLQLCNIFFYRRGTETGGFG